MKPSKRLLIGTLVSAALCQSGASALSTAGRLGVGAGCTFAAAGLITLVGCYMERDLSDKQMLEMSINKAKKKIISCIGEKKYNILKNICDNYAVYEDYDYIRMNQNIRTSAVFLEVKAGDGYVFRSSNESEISSFWSRDNQNIPVKRISRELFKYCLYPVAGGVSLLSDKYFEISKDQDKEWGNGFEHHLNDTKYLRNSVFVSSDYKRVKLCYRELKEENVVLSASVVLDIERMNLSA